jgi:hypothetical protein
MFDCRTQAAAAVEEEEEEEGSEMARTAKENVRQPCCLDETKHKRKANEKLT